MSQIARRLAQVSTATVVVAGLVTASGQASDAAAPGLHLVPALAAAQQPTRAISGLDPKVCDDWGDGNCIQEHGQDAQVTLQSGATTQFTLSYRGNVTSSGVWPFTGGTGYNSLYNGDPVYWLQDSSGACLQTTTFSYGLVVLPDPACSDNPWAKWVGVGHNWWVNVGESDSHSGWYPYSAALQAGCTGPAARCGWRSPRRPAAPRTSGACDNR